MTKEGYEELKKLLNNKKVIPEIPKETNDEKDDEETKKRKLEEIFDKKSYQGLEMPPGQAIFFKY